MAGSIVLLQALHEQIYGNEVPMLASTLKALVVHTADDAGNPGPDYQFGWGLMNTLAAAWVVTNNSCWDSLPHIKEVSLIDGEYIEFDVLATTNEPLKVTICWTDPAGPIQEWSLDPTNVVLVNDLDLRVIAPTGVATNMPWVLDPINPTNAATNGDNFRDNIEQVVIPDPEDVWYTVRVTHKGSLSNGVQDVSIVITGNLPTNAPTLFCNDIERFDQDTNICVRVGWPGVVGALYEINMATNLLDSEIWIDNSGALSANVEPMGWIDHDMPTEGIRFYQLRRLR